MSTAHIDPDRLADHAIGSASLPDSDAAHLAACRACRLEVELMAAARQLGSGLVTRLDGGQIAEAVRARLAKEPREAEVRPSRHPGRWLAGLAAAAALVLAVVYGERGWPGYATIPDGPTPVEMSVLHELDGLNEPELEEILESIPLAAGAVSHPDLAPLVELNANDLERVLRTMEE